MTRRRSALPLLLALALLAPAGAHAAGPSGTWSKFLPAPSASGPSGRVYSSGIYDPNTASLVIYGGYPYAQHDVWRFPLGGPGPWNQLGPLGPSNERWGHGAIHDPVRNRMIVMGGYDNITQFNTVFAMSMTGAPVWTAITPAGSPPSIRRNHYVVYDPVRDRLLVFGGYVLPASTFVNDVWALNLSGPPVWTQLAPTGMPPIGRSMVEAVYDPVGDRLVIFGGWSGENFLGDVWTLTLAGTPAWVPLAPAGTPPSARRDGGAVYDAAANRVVFFGGLDAIGLVNDVWALTLAGTPAWTPVAVAGAPPTVRASFPCVLDPVGQRMVIFGGYDGPANRSDVWTLSLAAGSETWTNLWTPPGPMGSPPPNCDYAFAYDPTRNRSIHFGGKRTFYSAETWLWQLGNTPSFSELLTANRPSPRHSASGVFDVANDRMLMFGGYDNSLSYKNDVWSLNFAGTPDWTQVPALGPFPQARVYNSAIADPVRQRMVIFGGNPTHLNDTWVLPFTGPPQWTLLTPAGAPPPPRWGHSAAYDPARDQMVVFGGNGPGGDVNDTWALKFTPSPQWVQVSPLGGSPPARRNATLVYDSVHDRMLLFGGARQAFGGSDFKYDVWELSFTPFPMWTELSPTGPLPDARNQMQAAYEPLKDRIAVHAGWDSRLLDDSWFLTFDQPTAALVAMARGERTASGVALAWELGEGSDPAVAIQRSTDGTSWSPVSDAIMDASRRIEWADTQAPAGRVGYRLVFSGQEGPSYAGDVWVESGAARLDFALRAIGPNPAIDRAVIALSLPEARAARVDFVDLAGRRVLTKDLGTLDAGARQVNVDGLGDLPAGMYLVRLTAGRDVATSRLMVVR